jgi:lipopolysaccharide export system protein LptA
VGPPEARPAPVDRAKPPADSVKQPPADSGQGAKAPADSAKAPADSGKAPRRKPRAATRECILDFDESPPETRLVYSRVSEDVANTFVGGGFVGHCQGENNRLRADSAEQFQAAGVVNLYGNVVYEEPGKLRLTANHATYFTREGRLYADGNVVTTQLRTGSTLTSNTLEYYREVPGGAPSRMVAPGRPVARLIELDSAGRPAPPVTITANTLEQRGDSAAVAWGDVVINRETIAGYADSATFDNGTERARLIRAARIRNLDSAQAFTLTGDTIDLFTAQRQLTRVVALHKGTALSADVRLESERIDLRLVAQQLEEAYASGEGRSVARTATQDVDADSLHIRLPGQRLRELRAVGGAAARGMPDTTRMVTEDPDLLRGDSLYAWFDSTSASADSAGRPAPKDTAGATVREIQAIGSASSLFQMASREGRTKPPSITYTRGRRIIVQFDSGAVRRVRVDSAASGLFLEPAPDSLADTTGATARPRPAPNRSRPPAPRPPGGGRASPVYLRRTP